MYPTVWAGLVDDLTWNLATVGDGDRDRGTGQGTAPEPVAGTVGAVRASAVVLRDAQAPMVEVSPANANPAHRPAEPARSGKRPSRAAALRAARAAIAEQQARPAPVEPVLSAELAATMEGWAPRNVSSQTWLAVSVAVNTALAAYRPPSARVLANGRSVIVAFALWLHTRPERTATGDLTAVEFCTDGVVDAYLAGPLSGTPDASRATVRSVLRRVVRGLAPGSVPEPIAYQPVQPPYSPAECAGFVLMAQHQPTDVLRRTLSALVALGLGAGLGAEDQRAVAPCHIRDVNLGANGPALVVDVPGPRARTVVMRAAYQPLLRDALALHAKAGLGATTPLGGTNPDRKNSANGLAARAVTATGTGVDVSVARLRTTWLVACMSAPVPLGALLHASGLRTPRTFTDLLPYCPAPDPDAVAAVLRSFDAGGVAS